MRGTSSQDSQSYPTKREKGTAKSVAMLKGHRTEGWERKQHLLYKVRSVCLDKLDFWDGIDHTPVGELITTDNMTPLIMKSWQCLDSSDYWLQSENDLLGKLN